MATIVNNPGSERVLEVDRTGDATAGWAVAIIILVAVIGGLFIWVYYHRPAAVPANSTGGSINVTLPSNSNSGGGTGAGATGGGTTGGGTNTGY